VGEAEHTSASAAPAWLVLLVAALLVAVVGTGAFVVHTITSGDRYASPAERDIKELSDALAQNPDDVQVRLSLAYAYQRAGRFNEAIGEYDRVLAVTPDEPAALYNKGVSLVVLGRYEEGEESLRRTLEVRPGHALAAKVLGGRLMEREEWAELAEMLLPVVEADEKVADLQAMLGRAYEELGERQQALERYRLALVYDSDLPEALEGVRRLEVTP
jgi:tetratricopeptide (TPR) repeat protein